MRLNRLSRWILLLVLLFTQVTQVICAKPKEEGAEKIRTTLKQQFPDLSIGDISPSPIKGLYQISAGPNVLYATQDAHYVLSGDIIDLQHDRLNVTEEVRKQSRLEGLKNLGQEHMIIFSPKEPKYTVTVFTDVDCGYCRKMQAEMKKINDLGIAVRYLAYPRTGPNSPTFDKMVSVWCAKDKKHAISMAQEDKTVQPNLCANSGVLKEFQFGMQIGVQGTPTLIFEDGTMIPGYLPPDKLLEAAKHLSMRS